VPEIWTSLTSYPSISGPIDWVFGIGFEISRRPELTALLTAFPRAPMLILIMGIAHTKALVLDLTPPATSKRHKGRIATYPLLATRCLHQRRRWIATETTMLSGNRLGFHAVVCHRITFCGGGGAFDMHGARFKGASRSPSLYPIGSSFLSQSKTPPRAYGHGA